MNTINQSLQEADILFGLRPALEAIGFKPEEDVTLIFSCGDNQFEAGVIPPTVPNRGTALNTSKIGDAVMDWLNKAEVNKPFMTDLAKELGLPTQGEFDIDMTVKTKSMELTLKNCSLRCPCVPGVTFCCF